VWALGCTLAELVQCSKDYTRKAHFSNKKRVMFKGKSCYPLSPRDDVEHCYDTDDLQKEDQIRKICRKVKIKDRDLTFISNDEQMNKMKDILHSEKVQKSVKECFPISDPYL
jgi:hypothetical protein